jgi:site-specific DNA-methyltransferase (adenine-specific)
MNTIRILQNDCLDLLKSLEDQSIEVVVTSPPYNIGMTYNQYHDGVDGYIDWSIRWMTEALRVSRKGLVVNLGAKASDQNQLFLLMGWVAASFNIQNTIVWAKSVSIDDRTHGHFKPINSNYYINNCHEYVFHITNQKTPIERKAVGVPFTHKSNVLRFAWNKGEDRRCRGSVWHVPYPTRQKELHHPASYPEDLAEMMIKLVGGTGTVVDPFLGSGTTAVVCQRLGRDFLGCDIDPDYVQHAQDRLNKSIDS